MRRDELVRRQRRIDGDEDREQAAGRAPGRSSPAHQVYPGTGLPPGMETGSVDWSAALAQPRADRLPGPAPFAVSSREDGIIAGGLPAWESYDFDRHGPVAAGEAPDLGTGPIAVAARGLHGPAQALPFGDRIQASFGAHDVSGIVAHVGGDAADAAGALGADAYAIGNHVAFAGAPDLHTAAHEAAHVIQQRAGVQLHGGMGSADDAHEQHADAVAAAVVAGESAEGLLGAHASGAHAGAPAVQLKGRGETRQATPMAPGGSVKRLLGSADDSARGLANLAGMAATLVDVMDAMIRHRASVKEGEAAYEEARAAYIAAKDQEAALNGILAIAGIGLSLSTLAGNILAVKRHLADATLARKTDDVLESIGKRRVGNHREVGDAAKQAREGASEAVAAGSAYNGIRGGPSDAALPDALAQAMKKNNEALARLTGAAATFDLQSLYQHSLNEKRALDDLQDELLQGVPEMTAEQRSHLDRLLASAERSARSYMDNMMKAQQLLQAFNEGGADALAGGNGRGLFNLVATWFRQKDPRTRQVAVSIDGFRRHVVFDGTHEDHDGTSSYSHRCHAFRSWVDQRDRGRIFVRDPAIGRELIPFWEAEIPTGAGPAEEHTRRSPDWVMDMPITASTARALASLGVESTVTPPTVWVQTSGMRWSAIERVSPDQLDSWYATGEFQSFWSSALDGQYAHLYDRDARRRVDLPWASDQARERSTEYLGGTSLPVNI